MESTSRTKIFAGMLALVLLGIVGYFGQSKKNSIEDKKNVRANQSYLSASSKKNPSQKETTPTPDSGSDPVMKSPKIMIDLRGAIKNPGVYELPPESRVKDLIKAGGGLKADADYDRINLVEKLQDGYKVVIPSKADRAKVVRESTPSRPVRRSRERKPEPLQGEIQPLVVVPDKTVVQSSSQTSDQKPIQYNYDSLFGENSKAKEKPKSSKSEKDKVPTKSIHINWASVADFDQLPGISTTVATRIVEYRRLNGYFTTVDQLDNVKGIGAATMAKIRPWVSL